MKCLDCSISVRKCIVQDWIKVLLVTRKMMFLAIDRQNRSYQSKSIVGHNIPLSFRMRRENRAIYVEKEEKAVLSMQPSTTNESPVQASPSVPSPQRARWGARAYAAAGLTVLLWASAFPGIRAALPHYSPVHVALLRYIVASLALAIYAAATRIRLPRWRDIPRFALLGVIGIAYYNIALNSGETHVPSAEASFLVASAPIFITIGTLIF